MNSVRGTVLVHATLSCEQQALLMHDAQLALELFVLPDSSLIDSAKKRCKARTVFMGDLQLRRHAAMTTIALM